MVNDKATSEFHDEEAEILEFLFDFLTFQIGIYIFT